MDIMLKKRYDLIPNLVKIIKAYAKHEKETFEKITSLRNNGINTTTDEDKFKINTEIKNEINSLFLLSENYPDLKSNINFIQLQTILNDIEDQISAARRTYNAHVTDYNIFINQTDVSGINYVETNFKSDKSLRLITDIKFDANELNVETFNVIFSGVLDGNGMTISDLRINANTSISNNAIQKQQDEDSAYKELEKYGDDQKVTSVGMFAKLNSTETGVGAVVKNLTLNVAEVYGDRDGLEQAITNILSNSIKYTPEGGNIKVYIGAVHNDAYIKIIDNGIGIPKEDLPRVFERFYRVDKARSRDMGGTGLGLPIAKEIIDSNNGSIDIKSDKGKGTEVIMKLPIYKNNIKKT
jgi:signal transduction histidine kinase